MEKNIYMLLNHFAVNQKLTQHCKSTILQFLKKRKKENVGAWIWTWIYPDPDPTPSCLPSWCWSSCILWAPSEMGNHSWRWFQECSEGNNSGYWPKFPFLYLLLLEETQNRSSHPSSRQVFLRSYSPILSSELSTVPHTIDLGDPSSDPAPSDPVTHVAQLNAMLQRGSDNSRTLLPGDPPGSPLPFREARKRKSLLLPLPTCYFLLLHSQGEEFWNRRLLLLFMPAWPLNPLSHWLTLSSLLLNHAPVLAWPFFPHLLLLPSLSFLPASLEHLFMEMQEMPLAFGCSEDKRRERWAEEGS